MLLPMSAIIPLSIRISVGCKSDAAEDIITPLSKTFIRFIEIFGYAKIGLVFYFMQLPDAGYQTLLQLLTIKSIKLNKQKLITVS